MTKIRKPTLVPVISAIVFLLIIASQQLGTIFAMHDSNLDVNTWIAIDNSTQVHTMDLNNGPMSPSATAAEGEAEEDEVVDEEEVDEENEEPSLEEEEGEDESE